MKPILKGKEMKRLILVVLCVFFAAACGDDGEKGGDAPTEFDSSFDDSRALSDLSESEAQTLCDEEIAYADARIPEAEQRRWLCTTLGAFAAAFSGVETDAELQTACAAARDECLADEEAVTESTCSYLQPPPDCSATIADAEACTNVQIDALAESNIECETLTLMQLEQENEQGTDPACEALSACEVQDGA
jgi:hypothetical protein